MKVLVNNYNGEPIKPIEHTSYPRKVICDRCGSELEYEKSDIEIRAYGCPEITCPLCGVDIPLYDEEELVLTENNISFPTHFYHTSKERNAVEVSNEKIEEYIREGINWLRANKKEYSWFIQTGDLHLEINKYDGDETYNVIVTKNYYETSIPFKREDYK